MKKTEGQTTSFQQLSESQVDQISDALIGARNSCSYLPEFPITIPSTLKEAYSIQSRSLKLWNEKLIGWKVGGIPSPLQAKFGASWLAGPIFENKFLNYNGEALNVPVFESGSAFVEAEFALELGDLSRLSTRTPTPEEMLPFIRNCYAGVEIASSPVANINDIGPGAIISDFGNNNGLVVGAKVEQVTLRQLSEIHVKTSIEGECVGSARAQSLPGGPLAAVAFLIANLYERGIDVPEGTLVSSGAITGVHPIAIGSTASVKFEGIEKLDMIAVCEK